MSPRSSKKSRGADAQSPPADIYVALLILSVFAISWGIVFMALELNAYGWKLP